MILRMRWALMLSVTLLVTSAATSARAEEQVAPPPPPPSKAPRRSSTGAVDAWVAFCGQHKADVMACGFKGGAIYSELGRRYRAEKLASGL